MNTPILTDSLSCFAIVSFLFKIRPTAVFLTKIWKLLFIRYVLNNSCFCRGQGINELMKRMFFFSSLEEKLQLFQLPDIFEGNIPYQRRKRKPLKKMTLH